MDLIFDFISEMRPKRCKYNKQDDYSSLQYGENN